MVLKKSSKYLKICFLFCIVLSNAIYASSSIASQQDKRAKFQFVFKLPVSKWDIPLWNYKNIANPRFNMGTIGLKYLSNWNLGIGVKLGLGYGTIDEEKFMNFYEKEWFTDQSGLLQEKRVVYVDTGLNFFSNFFLDYTYIYSKKINISINIGYMIMEIDDLLYPNEHELFHAGYREDGSLNVYGLYCRYKNSPFSAPSLGFSIDYKLNKMLSLNFDIEYFRARTEIEAYIEPDIPQENYPKTFNYRPELSIISVGVGGILRFGR